MHHALHILDTPGGGAQFYVINIHLFRTKADTLQHLYKKNGCLHRKFEPTDVIVPSCHAKICRFLYLSTYQTTHLQSDVAKPHIWGLSQPRLSQQASYTKAI